MPEPLQNYRVLIPPLERPRKKQLAPYCESSCSVKGSYLPGVLQTGVKALGLGWWSVPSHPTKGDVRFLGETISWRFSF